MAQSFGFSIPKNILKLWVGSFVFAIANIIYYKYFTSLGFMESYYDAFTFSFNRDSLKVFLPNIYKLEDGSLDNELTNITGISYFYYYLIPKISLSYTELSLVVNTFLFVATVFCIYKINSVLVIKNKWLFLLFLNPQFIYYSQTINKEPFTIFFFFCAAYLIISKRYIYLLFLILLNASLYSNNRFPAS